MSDIRGTDGVRFRNRPLGMLESFADVYLAHSLPCTNGAFKCETTDRRKLGGSVWYEMYENTDGTLASVTQSPHSELTGKTVLLRRRIGKGTVYLLAWIPTAKDMLEYLLPMVCSDAGVVLPETEGHSLMVVPRSGKDCEGLILAEFEGREGSYQLAEPMFEYLSEKLVSGCITVKPYEVLILEKCQDN